MTPKDEKNLAQVIDKIAKMDEPEQSLMQRVHEVIVDAVPTLKPRIWYGMPAYAQSASTPALVTLRPAGGSDGTLMPAAWYFESIDDATEKRIAEIVRSAVS